MSLADKFYIGDLDSKDEDFKFEVPNQYVESNVPLYYYLLPLLIFLGCFFSSDSNCQAYFYHVNRVGDRSPC